MLQERSIRIVQISCWQLRDNVRLGGCVFFLSFFFPLTCQVWSVMFSCVVFLVCCVVHILSVASGLVKLLVVSCLEFRPSWPFVA
jgi:hypothetical protein